MLDNIVIALAVLVDLIWPAYLLQHSWHVTHDGGVQSAMFPSWSVDQLERLHELLVQGRPSVDWWTPVVRLAAALEVDLFKLLNQPVCTAFM